MFDWTKLTTDPTNQAVNVQLHHFLLSLQSFYHTTRNDFLREYFRGARVLDIGAGEHDPSFYNEEKWEHGIIAKAASYAVGLDVRQELCDYYNQKGFRFVCADATSDKDLGERFDRIFLGDIIEHVNNPIQLLQFAKRHLNERGGKILLSTPNPFALSWISLRLRKHYCRPFYLTNFEHVSWVTPTNANEIARRAGLQFTKIYFPMRAWKTVNSLKTFLRAIKERLFPALGLTELTHKEYMYELTYNP